MSSERDGRQRIFGVGPRGHGRSLSPLSGGEKDLLSVVEAIYTFNTDRPTWLAKVLEAADAALGHGLSGFAVAYRALPNGTMAIDESSAAAQRHPPNELGAILHGLSSAPPGWLSRYFRPGGGVVHAVLTSEVDTGGNLAYRKDLAWRGVRDGLNIACADLDNEGVMLSLARPGLHPLDPESRADLVRIGTHLLAGFRLRRRLGLDTAAASPSVDAADPSPVAGAVEAVLTPEGKVLDASGEAGMGDARRALRLAVRGVENARRRARRDSREALKVWRGLVAARWTLVDEFDEADGSQYVVARVNVPDSGVIASLTPTERLVVTYTARGFSTKETAYALGLSDTTVRVLIMRAARRCGARDRAELLAMARGLVPTNDREGSK